MPTTSTSWWPRPTAPCAPWPSPPTACARRGRARGPPSRPSSCAASAGRRPWWAGAVGWNCSTRKETPCAGGVSTRRSSPRGRWRGTACGSASPTIASWTGPGGPRRDGGTIMPTTSRSHALAATLLWCAAAVAQVPADLVTDASWQTADLGAPATPGSHTWRQGTLTVTGAGAGLNVKGVDQGRFVYLTRAAGDFELVARLAGVNAEGAVAGLMARADNAPAALMTALVFKAQDNSLGWLSRTPAAPPQTRPRVDAGGMKLVAPPPLWLRLVRLGANFAVYRSRDGHLWSMISNVSGGAFGIDGPLQVGCF